MSTRAVTLLTLSVLAVSGCGDADSTPSVAALSRDSHERPLSRTPQRATTLGARSAGAERFAGLIDQIALSEGVDPALVHAVIAQESAYNPNALSPAGAAGLMQLMPGTAADYGLTPEQRFDPAMNIRAGVRHLKYLQGLFPGDLELVLAAYNAGQGTVMRYGRQVPPFRETRHYVSTVQANYLLQRQRSQQRLPTTRHGADGSRGRSRAREQQLHQHLLGTM